MITTSTPKAVISFLGLGILRRDYDAQITLTIAGPENRPQPGSPPEGVRFLGSLSTDELAALYDTHDLFVMPSRLEGFGIVFAEALARGLPCIGREAYAMPSSLPAYPEPLSAATTNMNLRLPSRRHLRTTPSTRHATSARQNSPSTSHGNARLARWPM